MVEWRAISARIDALLDAGGFFLKTTDDDNYGSADILITNGGATVFQIRRFLNTYRSELPGGAEACLERFIHEYQNRFGGADPNNPWGIPRGFAGIAAVLTSLASFRAEFGYLVADTATAAACRLTTASWDDIRSPSQERGSGTPPQSPIARFVLD